MALLVLIALATLWFFTCRESRLIRWTFLSLWVPAGMGAAVAFKVGGYGYSVAESLRLFAQRDPAFLEHLQQTPTDGYVLGFAAVVGGAVAAALTLSLLLLVNLVGKGWAITPPGHRRVREQQERRGEDALWNAGAVFQLFSTDSWEEIEAKYHKRQTDEQGSVHLWEGLASKAKERLQAAVGASEAGKTERDIHALEVRRSEYETRLQRVEESWATLQRHHPLAPNRITELVPGAP